jgi:hypothetical protein
MRESAVEPAGAETDTCTSAVAFLPRWIMLASSAKPADVMTEGLIMAESR